jgi:competence protein ComEC
MRFADFPFLRYLPFLLGGIFLDRSVYSPGLWVLLGSIFFLWLGYFILILKQEKIKTILRPSALAYAMLILFGAFLNQVKNESFPEGLEKVITADQYLAEVIQYDVQKPNSFENLLELRSVKTSAGWSDASGKVLVYHQSESPLFPGQILLVNKAPEVIPGAKNPNEFDYKSFLARKGIFHRQFIGKEVQIVQSGQSSDFRYFLDHLRQKMVLMLEAKIPDPDSRQVALALLLGQKQNLDPEIRKAYSETGVMHILAVSGLHVGIIYAIFLFLMKVVRLKKHQTKYYLIAVIGIIWLYAFLTGLSPSVLRAATMFSLITLGQMRERKPSIYNVLAFSAMLLITVNPDVIFDVGFQLSYLAVTGIVLIQPLIVNWWLPSTKVGEYFWQMTSVSIAAQLVTFPLSVYYFHVFPTYFLVANLFVIPISFLIMQVGVPLMILGWIPFLGEALGWILSWLVWSQNQVTLIIHQFPLGTINRLTIGFSGMVLIWALLLIWANWEFGDKKNLTWTAFFLIFFWSVSSVKNELSKPEEELIIYQGKKGNMFDFSSNGKLYSWNQGLEPEEISFVVGPNRIANQWSQFPEMLSAGQKEDSKIDFPFHSIEFSSNQNQFYFPTEIPKTIQIWEGDRWKNLDNSDSLKLGDKAFRILF